jgi:Xaa-Pro aminopeptidase
MLDPQFSRQRQRRLLELLQRRKLDAIVVGDSQHVYYLSAFRPFWLHFAGFILWADGRSLLVSPNEPAAKTAADEVVAYEANWFSTLRQEQPAAAAAKVLEALGARRAKSIGVDASAVCSQVALGFDGTCSAIDPELWQLRRRKDADELALMKTAIRCCEAMYRVAREIIEPGIDEIEVFNQLHAAAVKIAGEPLSAHLGNDYACGEKGGPPRGGRRAKAGELYILDLGPAYQGYFSDNARTFAVDRKPTDAQLKAQGAVAAALAVVEGMAEPGVRCRDIFAAVDEHFRKACGTGLSHHLGHGVGLQPHEYPHLNPKWDDTLIEGEIFTAEPGQYAPELAAGIRLENQYLVTASGVECLVHAPLELALLA